MDCSYNSPVASACFTQPINNIISARFQRLIYSKALPTPPKAQNTDDEHVRLLDEA